MASWKVPGLGIVAQKANEHRLLVFFGLVTSISAALFEGGTVGLIAVGASVIINDSVEPIVLLVEPHSKVLSDVVSAYSPDKLFLLLILVAVSAQVFRSGCQYASKYLALKLGAIVSRDLQARATSHVMQLSYSDVTQYPVGEINTLIGYSGVFSSVIQIVSNGLLAGVLLITYIGIMLLTSVEMTLGALVLVIILSVCMQRVVGLIRQYGNFVADKSVEIGRITIEYLSAPRLIRIFHHEKSATREINDARKEVIDVQLKGKVISAAFQPAVEVLTMLGVGAFLVIVYSLSVGALRTSLPAILVFLYVLNRLMPQVKTLNQCRMGFASAAKTMAKATEFLDVTEKRFTRIGGESVPAGKLRLELTDVVYRYDRASQNALDKITLSFEEGEYIAVIGGSGAGKSTLIDLILGLISPSAGCVTINGRSLETLDLASWLDQVGIVDQHYFLLNDTIARNIGFGREWVTEEDIVQAAKLANAESFITKLEDGYQTYIGNDGHGLSGGQRQRIALARALVGQPRVLILDEGTNALDNESEQSVLKSLREIRKDRIVIVVAHSLATIADADRIAVLDKGCLVEIGAHHELLEKKGSYEKLWERSSPLNRTNRN